jgi:retron-type reverse transcriptase
MNLAPKLVTKILVDRLHGLIHKNQYGFIKSRTIHDSLDWCFEYIHQYHQSRTEAIILKLDFEKAFDLVESQVIIQIMTSLGLPDNWIRWVTNILNSASTAVLLNGVPGKFFKCKRGVRQGDPLSPLLFVLAAELLYILVNQAASQCLIQAPIARPMVDFPIVQYANDTLLIMKADAQ